MTSPLCALLQMKTELWLTDGQAAALWMAILALRPKELVAPAAGGGAAGDAAMKERMQQAMQGRMRSGGGRGRK